MRWVLRPWRTVRGKLLLAAILVELVMLTVMVGNGLRLLYASLAEQARLQVEQMTPVLNAALVAPLAQLDYATVQAILDESHTVQGLDYLAVNDRGGRLVAVAGWARDRKLPLPDDEFTLALKPGGVVRYDVMTAITLAGQQLGQLHFGLNLNHIAEARRALLLQGILIALLEICLSTGILAFLGMWLTRHLTALAEASERVAAGNHDIPPLPEGQDDVGRLSTAFNAMSRSVQARVADLTRAVEEQAQLSRALEWERARLTALLSVMDQGNLFIASDQRVVYANPAFLGLWGMTRLPLGLPVERLFEDAHATVRPEKVVRLLAEGREERFEVTLSDNRVVVERRYQVSTGQSQPIGELRTYVDVTQSRQDARHLMDARDAAEAANRAKSEFLATMSHEIRTPMNGIIGMTGLLLDTDLMQEQRHYANTIRLSAEALLTIINDILDFSKMESGRLDMEDSQFEILPLIEGVMDLLVPRMQGKLIDLVHFVAPEARGVFLADAGRLRQVLMNLAGNAVKFTQRGSITVQATLLEEDPNHATIRFEVTDTGIGIPDSAKPRLFQMFTQADSSTARQYGGTGLGLAISKRIVEQMGGKIGFYSEEGKGSTFWVTVPLTRIVSDHTAQDNAPLPLSGVRIVVVDDNPTNREVFRHKLQSWGGLVTEATSATQGLIAIRQAVTNQVPFRIALLDHHMPGMSGMDLAAVLRADRDLDDLRVIIATSGGTGDLRAMAGLLSLQAILVKPIRETVLRNAMLDALSRPVLPDPLSSITSGSGETLTITDDPPPAGRRLPSLKVLVTDDNAINQQVAVGLLGRLGHRADVAADGLEAVAMVEKCNYDLVLMDMQMPRMDGITATKTIRALPVPKCNVPIVAMTANAMRGDRETCLAAGMDDYLAKPIDRKRLQAVLQRWEERVSEDQQLPSGTASSADSSSLAPLAEGLLPTVDPIVQQDLEDALGAEGLQRLLTSFRETMPHELAAIDAAFAANDLNQAAKALHSLRGPASNLGYLRLTVELERLEGMCRSGHIDGDQAALLRRMHGAADDAASQTTRPTPDAAL